jgi:hypothetical protein
LQIRPIARLKIAKHGENGGLIGGNKYESKQMLFSKKHRRRIKNEKSCYFDFRFFIGS